MTITSVAFASAIVALSALAPPLTAQQSDQWRRIDPLPGPTYRALTWDDAGMLYMVADGGVIARSADSGRTATMAIVDDQAAFADIEHDGAGGVWAVGTGGRIYRSVDGSNWQPRPVATTAHLNDIAFSTPSIGVVVGRVALFDTTAMYRTTNAGATWQPIVLPVTLWPLAVEFHGGVGLAVGGSGTVLRSSDAGATWYDAHDAGSAPWRRACVSGCIWRARIAQTVRMSRTRCVLRPDAAVRCAIAVPIGAFACGARSVYYPEYAEQTAITGKATPSTE